MSDFYTRKGDDGTSGLLGDERVNKDHPRLEAVGAIDEANSAFGIARAFCPFPETQEIILHIQRDLYYLMAELAASQGNEERFRKIDDCRIHWLEGQIDSLGSSLEIPNEFIVPGDSKAGAYLDLARTMVRKAERRITTLKTQGELENLALLRYLNRLSSFCFILGLWITMSLNDAPVSLAKEQGT